MIALSFFAISVISIELLLLSNSASHVASYSHSFIKPKVTSTFSRSRNLQLLSTVSSEFPGIPGIEEPSAKKLVVPTVLDLLKFGLPTLGIWLLQPILSLIDTSVIGMNGASASSVLELAALGPGIAWIDSSTYLWQFMGMATTNLYAIAIAEGDVPKQKKVLSHATILSTALGLILFVIQYTFAKPIVTVLAGSALDSIPYALAYSRIRSFASIIAVPTIVGQAAFLANKDSVTPLKAVIVGSIINIVGDLLLVCVLGKGIVGAAWATTASQIGSALFLLYASVRNTMKSQKNVPSVKNIPAPVTTLTAEELSTGSSTGASTGAISGDNRDRDGMSSEVKGKSEVIDEGRRQQLAEGDKNSMRDLVQIPGVKDITQFLSFCGPLFFVLLMKAFSWSYTTYACSPAGPVSLAAHQIVLNIFCIFAIFGDAVSQISQTYLPPFLGAKKVTEKMYSDAKTIITNIMKISFSLGLFNCIFSFLAVSKYGQKIFTKSIEVNAAMGGIVLYLAAAIFPNTIMAGLEGVLIATRDVTFHSLTYLVTGSLLLLYQNWVRNNGLGLIRVWQGIATFSWVRLTIFSLRVRSVMQKKKRESAGQM